MKCRELIVYILENGLEDVSVSAMLQHCLTPIEQWAEEHGCGTATVRAYVRLNKLNTIVVNDKTYIVSQKNN